MHVPVRVLELETTLSSACYVNQYVLLLIGVGVTVSSRLSVADDVQNIISCSAQTMHALRQLREHGLCDTVLQTVYRAVVVASAW